MITPKFHAVNQHWASPDHHSLTQRAPLSHSEPSRASPTKPRRWSHRPKSPRVVIPAPRPRDLSNMARNQHTPSGSLSKAQRKKRRRLNLPHTPVLRREQAPRDAKPVPSIEESAQKGPFDPYAFLSLPPTPSLPSPSSNESTASGDSISDVSSGHGKMVQPPLASIQPQEHSFGHRHSLPYRTSARKNGPSSPFLGRRATENAGSSLSLNPRSLAGKDASNEVKREQLTPFTPLIKNTTFDASLQNTQLREQKLKENGIVELDRDEYALQRFIKVNSEMSDLEAILMKGKKKHVFEQIKRNAVTKSLSGAERTLAGNDGTPTPSARPTTLREGIATKGLVDERNPQVASKVVDTRTEISKCGPASTRDAPSTSLSGQAKTDRPHKEHRSDHGAVHPSRKHIFEHSEDLNSHSKSQIAPPAKPPPKRKELPGMGLIWDPRPKQPQDDREHQSTKLPRDLKRREFDMREAKDTVAKTNDADIDSAIDSAQNWLQQENALYQEAREKRWQADPNWKHLTAEQMDTMRRQGSIPPATFYGHPPRWRAPTGWKQPPTIEKPIFTVAMADEISARLKEDRMLLGLQHTKDKETDLVPSRLPRSNGGKVTNKPSKEKVQSSTLDENKRPPTNGTANSSRTKAKSTSLGEKKEVNKAIGHEVDSQRSMKDGQSAVESQVKDPGDTARPSKVKTPAKKRKHDAEVSETTKASTAKVIPDSPDLPSMQEIMDMSQKAANSSPSQKKKRKKSLSSEAVEDGVNDAQESSTPSKSKKRKKAKETIEEQEVARDEASTTTKKRKKSGPHQEPAQPVLEKETFNERLRRLKREEKALAVQVATKEPSQPTVPTLEAATSKEPDLAPPTAPEAAVEDIWQPTVDDEDPISPPQPTPPRRKKHKSKHDRSTNTSPATAVDDITPETNESSSTPASPPSEPTRKTFNQHRRRHQSLPPPNTTTANSTTTPPQPLEPAPPQTPLDLTILSIRTRLSNLEAAITNPPNPATLTPTALLKLRKPPLPRAIPPGTTQLSDAELIEVGKNKSKYERHKAAPYAFSWRGTLYAAFDYLLDWVDEGGVGGWDCKVKARLKHN